MRDACAVRTWRFGWTRAKKNGQSETETRVSSEGRARTRTKKRKTQFPDSDAGSVGRFGGVSCRPRKKRRRVGMRDRSSLRGEPSIPDAPCSRCGWRRRTRCTNRRLRNARGNGSAIGVRAGGRFCFGKAEGREKINKDARARAPAYRRSCRTTPRGLRYNSRRSSLSSRACVSAVAVNLVGRGACAAARS